MKADLTLLSDDKDKHCIGLAKLDECDLDLDLELRADKCYSLSIVGQKCVKDYTVELRSRHTKALSSEGTKFLGSYVTNSRKSTVALTSSTLLQRFNNSLKILDSRHIHGEYKLWIYQNYLAPSFHFYLAVNPTTSISIKKMEALSTKMIKRWLKLPRNAILYHLDVLKVPQASKSSRRPRSRSWLPSSNLQIHC